MAGRLRIEWEAFFRALVALLFLYTGVPKVLDPAAFAESVYNYQLLPGFTVNVFALFLPWLEVVVALVVLLPGLRKWRRASLLLAGGMLILFMIAQASVALRGIDISCGCSLPGGSKGAGWSGVWLNLGFLVPVLGAWMLGAKVESRRT